MTEIMLAVCVCVGLVALGEIISYFTKAIIPSMAGALIIYLILIWVGMPTSYPEAAGFTYLGDFVLLAIVKINFVFFFQSVSLSVFVLI